MLSTRATPAKMRVICVCGHERLVHHGGGTRTYGRSCGMVECECSSFTPIPPLSQRGRRVKPLDRSDQKLFS